MSAALETEQQIELMIESLSFTQEDLVGEVHPGTIRTARIQDADVPRLLYFTITECRQLSDGTIYLRAHEQTPYLPKVFTRETHKLLIRLDYANKFASVRQGWEDWAHLS